MRKVGFLFLCVMSFMGSIMAQKSNVGDAKWSFGGGLLAADLFSPKPGIDYGFKNPLQFGPGFQYGKILIPQFLWDWIFHP